LTSDNLYRDRWGILNRETGDRITTDRDGNVYRRNEQGNWDLRNNGAWRPVNDAAQRQSLEHQEQQHDRGLTRMQNFQRAFGGTSGIGRWNVGSLRELASRRR